MKFQNKFLSKKFQNKFLLVVWKKFQNKFAFHWLEEVANNISFHWVEKVLNSFFLLAGGSFSTLNWKFSVFTLIGGNKVLVIFIPLIAKLSMIFILLATKYQRSSSCRPSTHHARSSKGFLKFSVCLREDLIIDLKHF